MINHGNPINLGWWLGGYLSCSDPYSTQWTWGLEVLSVEVPWIKQQQYNPWRIHGAGILMLTWLGYIDDKCYIVTIYSSTMDPSWVKKKLLTSQISHRPNTPSPARLSGHASGVVSWGQLLPWRFHQCVPRPRTPTSHRPSSSRRPVAVGTAGMGMKTSTFGGDDQ